LARFLERALRADFRAFRVGKAVKGDLAMRANLREADRAVGTAFPDRYVHLHD